MPTDSTPPEHALTVTTAESATWTAASASPSKSWNPGQSIRVICSPAKLTVAIASCTEIWRCCSSGS